MKCGSRWTERQHGHTEKVRPVCQSEFDHAMGELGAPKNEQQACRLDKDELRVFVWKNSRSPAANSSARKRTGKCHGKDHPSTFLATEFLGDSERLPSIYGGERRVCSV